MASWRPARVASPSAPNSRPGLRAQGGSPRRSLTFSLLLLSTTGAAGARAARPQPEAAGEFMRAAVSGGVAAAAATVALHPVDTIKTVLQQGGTVRLGGLYRGVVPAALSMMPACAVRMGAYETFKSQLLLARPYPALLTASGLVALSSALSVVVSAVVRSPLDMIKTQVQVGAAPTVQAAMRTAWQGGGLAAVSNFYRGAHLTLLRDVPFFTMNLVIYEELKAAAVKKAAGKRRAGGGAGAGAGGAGRQSSAGSLGSGEAVWLGAVAQGVAGFATNPVDVLKTRVQSGASPGMRAALRDTLRSGGPRALMRGAGMRTIWIMPQGCVYYPVYEAVQRLLAPPRGPAEIPEGGAGPGGVGGAGQAPAALGGVGAKAQRAPARPVRSR